MTQLTRLQLTDFRCFAQARFDFEAGLNVIQGANASGKTALIEAVWLLAAGRSFRTPHIRHLVRHGAVEAVVFAQVDGHRLGWARRDEQTRLHLDGEAVRAQAALSRHLPALLLTPESHRLLDEGPRGRRRFLDWGGFHHHARFMTLWRDYRQALRQRNAALRLGQPPNLVRLWDAQLVSAGKALDALRRDYVTALQAPLQRHVAALLPELSAPVSLHYHSGWRQELSLSDALDAAWAQDAQQRQTRVGPHRADLRFRVGEHELMQALSRGQQKLFVCALMLAQAELFYQHHGQAPLMLIDDLPAELDATRRSRLLRQMQALDLQSLVTTPDPALLAGVAASAQVCL